MNRKDEIIRLQMDVINQMTQTNLRRIADDLWGVPTLQSGGTPVVKEPGAPADAQPAEARPAAVSQRQESAEAPKTQEEATPPESIEELKRNWKATSAFRSSKKRYRASSTSSRCKSCAGKTTCRWTTFPCTWCFPVIPAPVRR